MKAIYEPPKYNEKTFTCPFCHRTSMHRFQRVNSPFTKEHICNVSQLLYDKCNGHMLLDIEGNNIYLKISTAPAVGEEFSANIQEIIEEARLVFDASPRAALALLRVALEHICTDKGFKNGYLKGRLENLIKDKQLSQEIIDDLTLIKALGDDSVHAIPIIEGDTKELATLAFNLVANIGDTLYTQPNRRKSLLAQLKDGKRLKTVNDITNDKEEEE